MNTFDERTLKTIAGTVAVMAMLAVLVSVVIQNNKPQPVVSVSDVQSKAPQAVPTFTPVAAQFVAPTRLPTMMPTKFPTRTPIPGYVPTLGNPIKAHWRYFTGENISGQLTGYAKYDPDKRHRLHFRCINNVKPQIIISVDDLRHGSYHDDKMSVSFRMSPSMKTPTKTRWHVNEPDDDYNVTVWPDLSLVDYLSDNDYLYLALYDNWGQTNMKFHMQGVTDVLNVLPCFNYANTTEPVLNAYANIREGPGTNYPVTGSADKGTIVEPLGYAHGDVNGKPGRWIKTNLGWIWDELLRNLQDSLPAVSDVPALMPKEEPSPTVIPVQQHVCDTHFQVQKDRENCYWREQQGLSLLSQDIPYETIMKVLIGRPDNYGWRKVFVSSKVFVDVEELLVNIRGTGSSVKNDRAIGAVSDPIKSNNPVLVSGFLKGDFIPLQLSFTPKKGTGYNLRCDQLDTPPASELVFHCWHDPSSRR